MTDIRLSGQGFQSVSDALRFLADKCDEKTLGLYGGSVNNPIPEKIEGQVRVAIVPYLELVADQIRSLDGGKKNG